MNYPAASGLSRFSHGELESGNKCAGKSDDLLLSTGQFTGILFNPVF